MRRLILLLAAMAIIAGCSTTVQGQASPVGVDNGRARVELPPRPRELPLDNIDPCSLLTVDQRVALGLGEASPQPHTRPVDIFKGPACSFIGSGSRNIGVSFTLATSNGIETLTKPGAVQAELIRTDVSNFPAVILNLPFLPSKCLLNIDVAQGQFLNVIFTDDGQPPAPFEQVCIEAKAAATQALLTLEGNT